MKWPGQVLSAAPAGWGRAQGFNLETFGGNLCFNSYSQIRIGIEKTKQNQVPRVGLFSVFGQDEVVPGIWALEADLKLF